MKSMEDLNKILFGNELPLLSLCFITRTDFRELRYIYCHISLVILLIFVV